MQFTRVKEIDVFEEYQNLLDSLKLNEFIYFCEDFNINLSETKVINREQLTTLFKLTTNSKMGISFDSFLILLKHITTVYFEKSKDRKESLNKISIETPQPKDDADIVIVNDKEGEPEDDFGNEEDVEEEHKSQNEDENMQGGNESNLEINNQNKKSI